MPGLDSGDVVDAVNDKGHRAIRFALGGMGNAVDEFVFVGCQGGELPFDRCRVAVGEAGHKAAEDLLCEDAL